MLLHVPNGVLEDLEALLRGRLVDGERRHEAEDVVMDSSGVEEQGKAILYGVLV